MIWLVGSRGMLGTELALALTKSALPFLGTDREVDITSRENLDSFAEKYQNDSSAGQPGRIDWIINCAAYTAVDRAEDEAEACRLLNVSGSANIAAAAARIGARLIHISTDYVFDGEGMEDEARVKRPYREDDAPNPQSVYGATKWEGEQAVLKINPYSYIIRTAWLYGRYGKNFVNTMLRLMTEQNRVTVVNDQRGSPTWAKDLAAAVVLLIKAKDIPYGIYHYTNKGDIVWYDFAGKIAEQAFVDGLIKVKCTVVPCTSASFPSRVKRPAYSVLDKTKITKALALEIPVWNSSLSMYLKELCS
ncbi:MAG: dTDP-4-dehydrorhamnose reductase [Treponema sp.]|jgi:dTDP-4-dehydrorhamnose reductase|nr:dTDP-4-dehydrorhamnose reductase [Treponema sp.]